MNKEEDNVLLLLRLRYLKFPNEMVKLLREGAGGGGGGVN